MSNPLDTLASEAAVVQHQNGDVVQVEERQAVVEDNGDDDTPLSVEEAAGGPPMPPAGQQGAALKEAIGALPPADDHVHVPNSPPAPQESSLMGGHGDAAMAAIDIRLDEDAPIPHTNGYLEQGLNAGEELQQPNELEYERVVQVANSTDQDVQEGVVAAQEEDRIPPMSMDIDQPQGIEEPDSELPLPIAQSLESAREASLAVDSLLGAPSASESIGEAILPAPGQNNEQPLSQLEPEPEITTAVQESLPSPPAQETALPAGESTLSSIPDTPAPLPSQLVNHTVPTTDATLSLPSPSSETAPESSSTTAPPQILENGTSSIESVEPQQRQTNAPPASLSNLLDSSAPTPEGPISTFSPSYAPIPSPSLTKRPLEDDYTSNADANAAAEANYFGISTAQDEAGEPSFKRQRVSPEAMSEQASAPIPATAEGMQLDPQSQSAPFSTEVDAQQQQGSAIDADGDADAEADAEGDSDLPAPPKTEQSFADDSMIDQSLDMSMVSSLSFR